MAARRWRAAPDIPTDVVATGPGGRKAFVVYGRRLSPPPRCWAGGMAHRKEIEARGLRGWSAHAALRGRAVASSHRGGAMRLPARDLRSSAGSRSSTVETTAPPERMLASPSGSCQP
eukprot:4566565-Pyramimonas_sp.AAC.1